MAFSIGVVSCPGVIVHCSVSVSLSHTLGALGFHPRSFKTAMVDVIGPVTLCQ